MAQLVGFSPEDAQRIAEVVRAFEGRLESIERQRGQRPGSSIRVAIAGRLTSTLTRGGKATMAVYQLDPNGGLGAATGEEYDVADSDELASDMSPVPINVRCKAIWCDGIWSLITLDCDLEVA